MRSVPRESSQRTGYPLLDWAVGFAAAMTLLPLLHLANVAWQRHQPVPVVAEPLPAEPLASPPSPPSAPAAEPGAAGESAGAMAAARVTVEVTSDPAGAVVYYPGGSAPTPLRFQLPRSQEAVTLQVRREGYFGRRLVVVPDVPRSHFVRLQAKTEAGAGDSEDAVVAPAAPVMETPGAAPTLDRFVDGELDLRLRGCCSGSRACGQVLLEGEASAGRIQRLEAHVNPPQPEAVRCLSGVMRAARGTRVLVSGAGAQPFMRSYSFDAR